MSELINIAARLARCQPLYLLDEMLEEPTRLNRHKLREALYAAENALKEIAIQLRDLHDNTRTHPAEALPEPVADVLMTYPDGSFNLHWHRTPNRGDKLYASPMASTEAARVPADIARDAARYQWLCKNANLSLGGNIGDAVIDLDRYIFSHKTKQLILDDAIDEAIAATPPKHGECGASERG